MRYQRTALAWLSLVVLAGCGYMVWGQRAPEPPVDPKDRKFHATHNQKLYDLSWKLKKGMPYDEVVALLGKTSISTGIHPDPNDLGKTGAYHRDDLWQGDEITVSLRLTERKMGQHKMGVMRLLNKAVLIHSISVVGQSTEVEDPDFDK